MYTFNTIELLGVYHHKKINIYSKGWRGKSISIQQNKRLNKMFYELTARDKTPYLASTKFHWILATKKTI